MFAFGVPLYRGTWESTIESLTVYSQQLSTNPPSEMLEEEDSCLEIDGRQGVEEREKTLITSLRIRQTCKVWNQEHKYETRDYENMKDGYRNNFIE